MIDIESITKTVNQPKLEESQVLPIKETTQKLKTKAPTKHFNNNVALDVEKVIDQIQSLKIDITKEYNSEWLAIGYALADEFGESGRKYFHQVSENYEYYDKNKADIQFDACFKANKNNGIKPFFSIAKKYGIDISPVKERQVPQEKQIKSDSFENTKENKAKHDFYKIMPDGQGKYKSLKINKVKLLQILKNFGFFRFDIDTNTNIYIFEKDNTLKEVSTNYITDVFIDYIKQLKPYQHNLSTKDGPQEIVIDFKQILESVLENIDKLFSKNILNRLTPDKKFEIQNDSKTAKYFYFQNGFVEVSNKGVLLKDYSELKNFVWSDQILTRDYVTNTDKGNFEMFFENICKSDNNRIKSLKTFVGYLLHNYMECKLFACIFTDSKISEDNEANGRTGKTLLMKSLGKVLNSDKESSIWVEINGKDKRDDKHKYQSLNKSTQLLHLNDVKDNFDIESLYSDITEGLTVEKKNQGSYTTRCKVGISTNKSIKIEGDSSIDRTRIFEFSEYYSSKFSPDKEFNQWFFTDWDKNEWNKFDTFIFNCCLDYFKNDCEVIVPETLTLHRRSLIEHTNHDFVIFMDRCLEGESEIDPIFKNGTPISKKVLFDKFVSDFSDFKNDKFKQTKFTSWMKKYFKKSNIEFLESRSNSTDYITLNC